MPTYQYRCCLVAQFTEDIYKNSGASDVLPLVMKSLDAEKVLGVQFLRAGTVRLTFDDPETCSTVLKDGLDLGDLTVQLFPADDRVRLVHLRDLPDEVDHDNVSTFFSAYGEVLSVDHCYFEEYPSVSSGNRIVKIFLTQDIPCFVEVEGCNCIIWYPRQPAQCSICREFGHRAPACPLSGRCRCCRQPGHVTRQCTQAWGSPSPVLTTLVPPDHAMETEDATSSSSAVPDPLPDPVITTAHVSTCSHCCTHSLKFFFSCYGYFCICFRIRFTDFCFSGSCSDCKFCCKFGLSLRNVVVGSCAADYSPFNVEVLIIVT